MLSYRTIFPVSTGVLATVVREALAASARPEASGVTVQRKRPDTMPKRLVTFRDDGGPNDVTVSRRRIGLNVWAEDSLTAEKLALLVSAILATVRGPEPLINVTNISSPYEIDDDTAYTFADANLAHFFIPCTVNVRASNF